jgi:hypothetical protein
MAILIGLAGPAGVGKDTAARYIADEFSLLQYAFASPIKDALQAMGFDRRVYDQDEVKDAPIPELNVSYRKLAQTLGTEWGRAMHEEFWLMLGKRRFAVMQSMPEHAAYRGMVVSDVRFPNEAQWVRETGLLIHLAGPSRRPIAEDGSSHASEAGICKQQGDVVVTNTGSLTFLFGQLNATIIQTFFSS